MYLHLVNVHLTQYPVNVRLHSSTKSKTFTRILNLLIIHNLHSRVGKINFYEEYLGFGNLSGKQVMCEDYDSFGLDAAQMKNTNNKIIRKIRFQM